MGGGGLCSTSQFEENLHIQHFMKLFSLQHCMNTARMMLMYARFLTINLEPYRLNNSIDKVPRCPADKSPPGKL